MVSALFGSDDLGDLFGREASAADGVEGAGEGAHHFVEKAGAFGGEGEMLAALFDVETVDGFDRIGVVVFAVGGAERGKVVSADHVFGGCAHGVEVERQVAAIPDGAGVVGGGSA